MEIRTVGICQKPDQNLVDDVRQLAAWLGERGIECFAESREGDRHDVPELPLPDLVAKADLLIVLGGDGTLLAVARAVGEADVPILGVNLGTLGFLAETARDELFPALEKVLAGGFGFEQRMRIEVSIERGGAEVGRHLALNDAVIARSTALSRVIDLDTRADGVEVTTYHADGLIAATPTGSSAYSLSAGGPLLLPTSSAILLTPICPHTLSQRPLVLPADTDVEIHVRDARGGEVHLTVDGQVGCELQEGDRVRVRQASTPVRMLVPPERNRYQAMREKLGWGTR